MSNGHWNRNEEKEASWRRHLVGQASSGLSARAYCRQHGLSAPLFYAWRREIQKRDTEQVRPRRTPRKELRSPWGDSGRRRSAGTGSTSMPSVEQCSVGDQPGSPIRSCGAGLIALDVIDDPRPSKATSMIEIACPGGPVIRLREDVSLEVLERVMAACQRTRGATSEIGFSLGEVRSC